MVAVVKQYDSRWGRKNYNGSSTIAAAACGPFSVDNIIIAPGNTLDPMKVVRFMQTHGYAVRNHGTAWNGIPAAMKNFGCEDVRNVNVDKSMSKVWEYMEQGYSADFLFSAGSRGGICWTTAGHYVAVTDYKKKDGKHWLYTRDSGGRDHDGWYCYEKHMRGLIPKVWVGFVPKIEPKPKKRYTGTFPTLPKRGYFKRGDSGDQVKLMQKFLKWAIDPDLKADGDFGYNTEMAVKSFESAVGLQRDGQFGKKCLKAAKKYKR